MSEQKKEDYICPKIGDCYNLQCGHRDKHEHNDACNRPPTGGDISDGLAPCNDRKTFCVPYRPNLVTRLVEALGFR